VTVSELQQALKALDPRLHVSPNIESLFQEFLPDGLFEAAVNQFKPVPFKDGDTERGAVEVHGVVRGKFLGIPDLRVQADFFVMTPQGPPEVVMRFSAMPGGLAQGFPTLPDREAFSECIFVLDSRRPEPLGKDFDDLFSPAKNVKRGLRLEATLDVSKVDKMAGGFVGSKAVLHVKGPVELQDGQPRMRLTATEDLPGPEFLKPLRELLNSVEFRLKYQYLSATEEGRQKTKERYKLTFRKNELVVPLAITVEPNMLSESLIIESDWEKRSSPLSLKNLMSFLPSDQALFKGLFPDDATDAPANATDLSAKLSQLPDIKLDYLLVELDTDAPSLLGLSARVESDLSWTIVKGKKNHDLVRLDSLGVDLDVTYCGDQGEDGVSPWEVSPYLTGRMELAGGWLSGVVDVSARSFCLTLDDGPKNAVNLKTLITEVLGRPEDTVPFKDFRLTRFEILGDVTGKACSIDIGTDFILEAPPVQVGSKQVEIKVKDLSLKVDYDGKFTLAVGGALEIFEMTVGCFVKYEESQGATLDLAIFNLSLQKLLKSVLGEDTNVEQFPDVEFQSLQLNITPKTGAFRFHGRAMVDWPRPFNSDAHFRCEVELRLHREAVAAANAICHLQFKGDGSVTINEKELAAYIDVEAVNGDKGLTLSAKGSLTVPLDGQEPLTIGLKFDTDKNKKLISASWPDENHPNSGRLDFGRLAAALGAPIEHVPEGLIPRLEKLSFDYDFSKSYLLLTAETEKINFAFMTAPMALGERLIAFGLKSQKISTDDFGPLGSALKPYSLALNDLVVVAANKNAGELKLPFKGKKDTEEPISNGVLLKGKLEFEQTNETLFRYDFECNLGEKAALAAREGGESAATDGKTLETGKTEDGKRSEVGNNNLEVGRKLGPVTFRKARFESRDKDGKKYVYVLLDASFGAAGFELDLQGFNLNFPIEAFTAPGKLALGVGLEGLSIAFSQPPLTISGGFAVTEGKPPFVRDVYAGYLLIKAEAFQITVLGQYGNIRVPQPNSASSIEIPSLFLYGMYNGVLGGPAAFYVTGLALGGGYNTRLRTPSIEKVAEFPLVSAATKTDVTLTTDKLAKVVEASYGDYWLAVGVKFNSFKMADSFALFTVAFGNRLQFALLGLTTLTLPAEVPGGKKDAAAAVYAELAIKAVLDPEGGVFSIEGLLTENSYVFDKRFRLTGGFAFFVWFGNSKQAGDFVITLGGYHPKFPVPSHYPAVPRVGIAANLSKQLTVTGEAYLAITPSCLMIGLKIAAVYQSGNLTAAFVAYADFMIAWAPFYYDGTIGIGISVVHGSTRAFKLEVGADLHVWGPPFSGTATVTLWIVSFTVAFGATQQTEPAPLNWQDFGKAFLPVSATENQPQPATIRITEGVVGEFEKMIENRKVKRRIVNPHELVIETDSAVPCGKVTFGSPPPDTDRRTGVDIRPMQAKNLTSVYSVDIESTDRKDNHEKPISANAKFQLVQYSRQKYPEALWPISKQKDANPGYVPRSGFALRIRTTEPESKLGPFPVEIFFADQPIEKKIPWWNSPAAPYISQEFKDQSKAVLGKIRDCLQQSKLKAGEWNQITVSHSFPEVLFGEKHTPRSSLGGSVQIEVAAQ